MTPAPPLIVHVVHHLVIGGMENGLVNLVNRLPAGAFRHAIACIEDYSDFRYRLEKDVQVFPLRRSTTGVWRLRFELSKLFRRLQPSIVHTRNLSGLDALLPARLAGVRICIHSEHGWDTDDLHGTKLRPALLRRVHSPLVTRYVTVSKDLQRYLVERVGIAESRITLICNGVDIQRFRPRAAGSAAWLPHFTDNPPALVIGTIGRAQAVKNQKILLTAFSTMLRRVPDMRSRTLLVVIGDGPQLKELREMAVALNIADAVWLPGARTDIPELLPLFDIFVLPSLNEGISNTVLEAMACGVPVVASNVGGNTELIDHGVTGLLIAAGDEEKLVDALMYYAANQDHRLAAGRAGRQRVERQFSVDVMVDRYSKLYGGVALTDVQGTRAPARISPPRARSGHN